MTAPKIVDPAGLLREQLESASPNLLRAMIKTFADALMSAEADAVCGAGYGERSPDRMNSRNGYRPREWDTRAGTVELAIPKLRSGSYFPDWLLQHRRRAEQALVSVVATSYLLGASTRRVEKLAEQLGVKQLSKSQVSEMATHLDAQVEAFRNRPLDSTHYTFVWLDALVIRREHSRTVNVHALVAVGVNADGGREVLGLGRGQRRGRGRLAGVPKVPDRAWAVRGQAGHLRCPPRPVSAVGAALPGAAWQRCRTHWSCIESSWRVGGEGIAQGAGGVVAGAGGCGVVSDLVQHGANVDEDVADGAGADVEQVGQGLSGAGLALVEDGGEDPLGVGEFLPEHPAAGAGQAVPAAAAVAALFDLGGVWQPEFVEQMAQLCAGHAGQPGSVSVSGSGVGVCAVVPVRKSSSAVTVVQRRFVAVIGRRCCWSRRRVSAIAWPIEFGLMDSSSAKTFCEQTCRR
jgi:hypothetical protein